MYFFVPHCLFSDQHAPFVHEFLLTLKLPSLLSKSCYWLTSGHYFNFLNYVSQHQTGNSSLHPTLCDYNLFLLIHIFEFLIFRTFLTCSILSTRIIPRSQILKSPLFFFLFFSGIFFALKLLSSDISLYTVSSSLLLSLFLSLCLNKQPYHRMFNSFNFTPLHTIFTYIHYPSFLSFLITENCFSSLIWPTLSEFLFSSSLEFAPLFIFLLLHLLLVLKSEQQKQ